MNYFFQDFSTAQIIILILAAVLIGINKTGLPGLGLVPVVLLANTFEAGLSTGLQLVMLCLADLAAVAWYRKNANWKIVLRLLPAALLGIGVGYLVNIQLKPQALNILIGVVILVLCALSIIREIYFRDPNHVPRHWSFSAAAGFLAGFTTLTANAAGPVMALYLLSMRLEKKEYIGTGAWYFLILNWLKLPIFCAMGRITLQSAKADLAMIPFLLTGAVLGIIVVKYIPQKAFEWVILVLSILGALKLLWS